MLSSEKLERLKQVFECVARYRRLHNEAGVALKYVKVHSLHWVKVAGTSKVEQQFRYDGLCLLLRSVPYDDIESFCFSSCPSVQSCTWASSVSSALWTMICHRNDS